MSLIIPRPGKGADRVLTALWEHGPMLIADLAAVANVKLDNLMSIAQEYKLRSAEKGTYELPKAYVKHFDQCRIASEPKAVLVITPPRSVNIWSPAMTGYEANMRRYARAAV